MSLIITKKSCRERIEKWRRKERKIELNSIKTTPKEQGKRKEMLKSRKKK